MLFWKSMFESPIMLYACTMHVWICACVWVSDVGFLHETLLSSALLLPQCLCVCICDLLSRGIYAKPAVFPYAPSYRCLWSTWPGLAPVLACVVTPGYSNTQFSPPPHPFCWSRQTHSFFLTALQLLLTGGSERRAGKALSKFGCTSVKLNWFVSGLHNIAVCFVSLLYAFKRNLQEAMVINISSQANQLCL